MSRLKQGRRRIRGTARARNPLFCSSRSPLPLCSLSIVGHHSPCLPRATDQPRAVQPRFSVRQADTAIRAARLIHVVWHPRSTLCSSIVDAAARLTRRRPARRRRNPDTPSFTPFTRSRCLFRLFWLSIKFRLEFNIIYYILMIDLNFGGVWAAFQPIGSGTTWVKF